MEMLFPILFVFLSYLLGAVPFGLLFSRLYSDVDIRSAGSGNIGATNVLRVAGKKAALLTLVADCLKGLAPVLLAGMYTHDMDIALLCGAAAILGHIYPVYTGFKGGKGVATGFGAALGLTPLAALLSLLTWAFAAYLWRYSSLAALTAFSFYPFYTFLLYSSRGTRAVSVFLFGIIYFKHRENIKRLLAGTEAKIGRK